MSDHVSNTMEIDDKQTAELMSNINTKKTWNFFYSFAIKIEILGTLSIDSFVLKTGIKT